VLGMADAERQEREIEGCRARLNEELGQPMRLFSYPVGLRHAFDGDTKALLRRAGVEHAVSLYGGYARAGAPVDPLDVPRASAAPGARLRATVALPRLYARW